MRTSRRSEPVLAGSERRAVIGLIGLGVFVVAAAIAQGREPESSAAPEIEEHAVHERREAARLAAHGAATEGLRAIESGDLTRARAELRAVRELMVVLGKVEEQAAWGGPVELAGVREPHGR
jgi:hypothetical protein